MRKSLLLEIYSIGVEVIRMARKYLKWRDAPIWVKTGRNIKDHRRWRGLTPEAVASKARIDLKRYKRMERAIVEDITIVEAKMIADALKVSEEMIIPF